MRFGVRSRAERAHLESGIADLVRGLEAQGFRATVTTAVIRHAEKESIFGVFASPGDVASVDLEA